jgi:hypothetical protein
MTCYFQGTGHGLSIALDIILAQTQIPGPDPIIAWVNSTPIRESDAITKEAIVCSLPYYGRI